MSLTFELSSASWWKASSARALRTAISVLLPFLLATTILEVDWLLAVSTVALSVVASYVTSLAGLKELGAGSESKFLAVLVRAVKTFAQSLAGFLGASVLITEVDWKTALLLSLSATIVTVLTSVLTILPEENAELTTT